NLCGWLQVDSFKHRIFLADRQSNLVRAYSYKAPGAGRKIDIELVKNFVVGEDPFALLLMTPSQVGGRKLFVGSLKHGELALIDAASLNPVDLSPDDPDSLGI